MPTFGKTTTGGGGSLQFGGDELFANRATLSEAGIATSMTFDCQGAVADVKLRGVLYADTGSDAPGAFLGVTDETIILTAQARSWVTVNFPSPISLSAGTYWIGDWANNTGATHGLHYYDVGSAGVLKFRTGGFPYSSTGDPASPFGAFTTSGGNEQFAVYVTYAIPGSGSLPTWPRVRFSG